MFENMPGVVTGLAWTSLGGATLQIEATAVLSRNKGLKQTGQLGAVMVESADIAYSYVMAHLEAYGAKPDFFDERFVHIHVPAGATPKDGPSAGVTMATALLSMVLQKPVRKHLAMTGELTLTGQVLPIGGVKEKVIAARRSGCKILIFPEANRKDFEELPAYLKKGLTVHFAGRYEEVICARVRRPRDPPEGCGQIGSKMISIVVGGHSRNVGKTSVAAGLIHAFRTISVDCDKDFISPACQYSRPSNSDAARFFEIYEEANRDGSSDTSRFLAAGARRVLWVRIEENHADAGMRQLLAGSAVVSVCDDRKQPGSECHAPGSVPHGRQV